MKIETMARVNESGFKVPVIKGEIKLFLLVFFYKISDNLKTTLSCKYMYKTRLFSLV